MGKASYERLRARAMILPLRHTGQRISDVATLERDRVRDGPVPLHTQKTGGAVLLPVSPALQRALDLLPAPRGAEREPWHFFWNGVTSRRAVIGIADLATEVLARGGTDQDAADVLGISPSIVRRHYSKWSIGRQQRIDSIMGAVLFGTNLARQKITPVTH
jgi:integrase